MAASALLRRRLLAQGLAGPPLGHGAEGPLAVTRRLLAIQAQDPRGFRLAIRARSEGTTAAEVDRALAEDRSLVVTWLNRGTLHLVDAEDYPLLQALVAPPLRVSVNTRLAQNAIDADVAERAVGLVAGWLRSDGPLSRHALRERLLSAGVPAEGQALVHVLIRASIEGRLIRGPTDGRAGGEHLYAAVEDWLPGAARAVSQIAADRDRALGELTRRFLTGHGPAGDRDLARWAGLPLRDARVGLRQIAGSLREWGADGLVELDDGVRSGTVRLPPPRLLGAFEPLLMGWRTRTEVLGAHDPDVVTGGIFRGFAFAGGRAVGVWRFAGPKVALEPFGEPSDRVGGALQRDGEAVTRFLSRR